MPRRIILSALLACAPCAASAQNVERSADDSEAPARLDVLWEKHRALSELVAERREADMRALQLQANEYERRLEHLNGEQERIASRNEDFVRKEQYESEVKALTRLVYIGLGGVLALQLIGFFGRYREQIIERDRVTEKKAAE